jgi:catechol 2,3-dioxygenase-like lactoylglutathione lyase family enzyme
VTAPAIPILTPHHVSISVPNIDEAIAWYWEILGFALQSRFEIAEISAQGAFLRREALWIELWQIGEGAQVPEIRKNPDTDLGVGRTKHVAFVVPDLQSHLAELLRRGVDIAAVQRHPALPMKIEHDPADPSVHAAFAAFIRDPGGTLIELIDQASLAALKLA